MIGFVIAVVAVIATVVVVLDACLFLVVLRCFSLGFPAVCVIVGALGGCFRSGSGYPG